MVLMMFHVLFVIAIGAMLAVNCNGNIITLEGLRVNSMREPISIDDPRPSFSWQVDAIDRAVVTQGYEIEVTQLFSNGSGALIWQSGQVNTNQTQFIPWPAGGVSAALVSNSDYTWQVRSFPGPSAWSASTFSTGLLHQSDWDTAHAQWIQSANMSSYASQMRKTFVIPPGTLKRARAFVMLPGYGDVWINGQKVDGRAGTRSLSQYDVRALYHTYDVQQYLRDGEANTIGVYVGVGWFGHPPIPVGNPPGSVRQPFGPPTLRLLLHIENINRNGTGIQITTVGTDTTWLETRGPVLFEDEYNGTIYDARLETPGWTTPTFDPSAPGVGSWTAVLSGTAQPNFNLSTTNLSAATFPAVDVIQSRPALTMTMPSPGVYVYDFGQNLPGWCKLQITGMRGVQVQLRHAEVLQHPPYGPADGNIYNANLRTATATDVYILKGDPNGETIEFSMSQHGFRYVELTFPGSPAQPPPSLNTIEVAYARSAMAQTGQLTVSNPLLQQVHNNIVWGQASNLMMVPTDCDQRDERYGWTGDAAITADEATQNFDMGAFYHNWLRMVDDSSQNGAVPCWVPNGVGFRSPHAGGSCDASWGSAFPSVTYALFHWNGDVTAPQRFWPGLTRFIDNEFAHTANGTQIDQIFATWGDWQPPYSSVFHPNFVPEPRADKEFVSGFTFVTDVGHMAEMAMVIEGEAGEADVAKYTAMYAKAKAAFHARWYNNKTTWYDDGGQTAQVLALALDKKPPHMMSPTQKAGVLARLVQNIVGLHGNHSTSGIIGFRYVMDVLSDNGQADIALAILTQTAYPSFGYQILNKYEPATTVWELWESDVTGPRMNSRNHIMFGGPGSWLHTYVGGIKNAAGSIGYESVWFAPPATLITAAITRSSLSEAQSNTHKGVSDTWRSVMADSASDPLRSVSATKETGRGTFALFWSLQTAPINQSCGEMIEGDVVSVNCTGVGINTVVFADYGLLSGDCDTGLKKGNCTTPSLTQAVANVCDGQDSCSLDCSARVGPSFCNITATSSNGSITYDTVPIADPCPGMYKTVGLQVSCHSSCLAIRASSPANSIATTAIPVLDKDPQDVTITESGTVVWKNGLFVPGVVGVESAEVGESSITINVRHGSGVYDFRRI
eukprot:m.190577 g.190577  ORF g.190577 m.190577 type:complete len:1125 (-) comp32410_c0_seq1:45-3419(-)